MGAYRQPWTPPPSLPPAKPFDWDRFGLWVGAIAILGAVVGFCVLIVWMGERSRTRHLEAAQTVCRVSGGSYVATEEDNVLCLRDGRIVRIPRVR